VNCLLDNTYHIIFLNVIEFDHNSKLSLERSFHTMRKLWKCVNFILTGHYNFDSVRFFASLFANSANKRQTTVTMNTILTQKWFLLYNMTFLIMDADILAVHDCFKHAANQDIFLLVWRQVLSYDVSLLNIRLIVNLIIFVRPCQNLRIFSYVNGFYD
jgi:hypothetical protein